MFRAITGKRFSSIVPALAAGILSILCAGPPTRAFDSPSTGADGALVLTEPGTVIFDPQAFDPPLDPEGDNVFHFTEVFIGEGVTLRLTVEKLGHRPVYWLARGSVVIEGTVDLSGENGSDGNQARTAARPGPGGFAGGLRAEPGQSLSTSGYGPGGGFRAYVTNGSGAGAGHANQGAGNFAGEAYGNPFLLPLVGGSGGGGGQVTQTGAFGGGGGAGGGALLVAAATITVDGTLVAGGGDGGNQGSVAQGGGGSGGAIRLVTPVLQGGGEVSAPAGRAAFLGSVGRISFEADQNQFTGQTVGAFRAGPVVRPISLPSESETAVRLARIAGVTVPANPGGTLQAADLVVEATGEVLLELEARGIPLGTPVALTLTDESGTRIDLQSTPLAGTVEASTADASVDLPIGFSRFTVSASWDPSATP